MKYTVSITLTIEAMNEKKALDIFVEDIRLGIYDSDSVKIDIETAEEKD